jgi:hypothetical protein
MIRKEAYSRIKVSIVLKTTKKPSNAFSAGPMESGFTKFGTTPSGGGKPPTIDICGAAVEREDAIARQ